MPLPVSERLSVTRPMAVVTAAVTVVVTAGVDGSHGGGGGHHYGGGGGRHYGPGGGRRSSLRPRWRQALRQAVEASITPTKVTITALVTTTNTTRLPTALLPSRPLRLGWPPIHFLRRPRWRLWMAGSQRYKHRQFLLVEPLLRVHWLLLSLNGLN